MGERHFECDIAVVGGGPAGLAAACTAAESGRRVLLLEESPWLGGQIWRGQPPRPSLPQARTWLDRFSRSGAAVLEGATVIAAPQPGLLLVERNGLPATVACHRLILATGARELFLPFPGWTLPGVFGPAACRP